jgi:hypothetical protein
MASESLRYLLEGEVLQESHRGISRPIFDLPPNPSIDHLAPVILKPSLAVLEDAGAVLYPMCTAEKVLQVEVALV